MMSFADNCIVGDDGLAIARKFTSSVVGLLIALLCLETSASAETFSRHFDAIKKSATPKEIYQLLFDLPKGADLHNHINLSIPAESWLVGATDPKRTRGNQFYTRIRFANCPNSKEPFVRFETIQLSSYRRLSPCQQSEYALLNNLNHEEREQWLSALKLDRPGEGRAEFFDYLGVRLGELSKDPYLSFDLLVENLGRYKAEQVRYVETQLAGLRYYDRDGLMLPPERILRQLRERLQQADAKATGVTMRFLATVVRFQPQVEQQLAQAYAMVAQNRDLWVGINVAGKEEIPEGHGLRLLETFRQLRRKYSAIPISIHAGETPAPGHEVRTALLLGASRIGHGINLLSDPDTLLLLRNNRYLVEINLISNTLLGYVPDPSKHPFPEYLRLGIPVCLNTDDRTAWDSNMTDEYFAAVTTFDLSWEEIVELGEASLKHAFVDADARAALLMQLQRDIAAFQKKYGGPDWQTKLKLVSRQVV
jgi:adenosine deaminase CECR1